MAFPMKKTLVIGGCFTTLAGGVLLAPSASKRHLEYDMFLERLNHRGDFDTVQYDDRVKLFEAGVAAVTAHNSRPDVSWTEEVNEFTDSTDSERGMMLGYRRSDEHEGRMVASLLQQDTKEVAARSNDSWPEMGYGWLGGAVQAPESNVESNVETEEGSWSNVNAKSNTLAKDWGKKLTRSVAHVRQQGQCGSCWAVAAAGLVEMYSEMGGEEPVQVSHVHIVNCMPNPDKCGGAGGCKGGTVELGLQYGADNGWADKTDAMFQRQGTACRSGETKSLVSSTGFQRLPINKLQPLLDAIYKEGPVGVSVDGGKWFGYSGGVFSGCKQDTIVNHAVVATGFGYDAGSAKKYWKIRNSWGGSWGEDGFIRLERHEGDGGEEGYCGTDNKPKDGVFCENPPAPKTVPVCGMCGVLSDSAYPKGVTQKKGKISTKYLAVPTKD